MAGLWERIKNTAEERVGVHLLEAGIVLHATNAFTKTQIRDAINTTLTTPLSVAETTDLELIVDKLDAELTTILKLVYLEKVKAWTIAAEHGVVTETQFRSALGI